MGYRGHVLSEYSVWNGAKRTVISSTKLYTKRNRSSKIVKRYPYASNNRRTTLNGDRLVVLRLSKDKKWAEVKKRDNSTGWIQFNSIKPVEDIKTFIWYHQNATRVDAEMKLRSGNNGSFLVRDSESIKGQLSLSLRCDERVYHYRINKDDRNQYYVNGERRFPTLAELIANHSQKADGLVCQLKSPIRSEEMDVQRMRPTYVEDRPDMLSSLRTAPSRGSRAKPHEIKRRELIMKHKLGGGQYGDVYEAFWKERQLKVAVKTLRADGHMGIDDFLSEAALMQLMEHPNLVKLYGVCSNEAPCFIVSEYMSKGNLTDYLKQEKPALPILIQMILQVSSAMAYLEHHHFIHRDLAARNCLVGDDHIVKVADFGLARILREDHYDAKSGSKFPIKWTAPEGLAYSRFSNKSDVWSFGVLLWEIMSYGAVPFVGINLSDVYQLLSRGYRMTVPSTCPKAVAKLMKKCWEWYPEDRPTFEMLMDEFDKMFNVHTTRPKDVVSSNGQKIAKSGKTKQKTRYYQTDDVFSMDKHELFKMEASPSANDKRVGSSKTSPRKLRSFMRSESCNPSTHTSNRTVRNDSSRASRNPPESRRSLKSQVLEPFPKVKTSQTVKSKNSSEQLEHHDVSYVRGSDDGSVSSGASSKEANRQVLPHMQSKHDLRSADESGYYEDDFKFSGTSLHEMIRNLEQLRRKIVDSAGLLPSERKSLMCIVEESQRNIHTYLDNIESAPLRFRLRESLDILNELVPKILGNRRCMYGNYSKEKSTLNDTRSGQTASANGDAQVEHFMRVLDGERDDNIQRQPMDNGSCLDWMVSKDSTNDVEQMDRILQFLIDIFSTTSIRQAAEDRVTTQIDTARLNDLNQ